jgi:DNA-binding transcriptional regulator YhcF (GntR family)
MTTPPQVTGATVLDRSSPLPLWAQLLADLRRRMAEGEFEERFPTEEACARDYKVSRQTVREALRRLADDGLLVRARGRGTTLARPEFEQPLHAMYSLSRSLRSQGVAERSQGQSRDALGTGLGHLAAPPAARPATVSPEREAPGPGARNEGDGPAGSEQRAGRFRAAAGRFRVRGFRLLVAGQTVSTTSTRSGSRSCSSTTVGAPQSSASSSAPTASPAPSQRSQPAASPTASATAG